MRIDRQTAISLVSFVAISLIFFAPLKPFSIWRVSRSDALQMKPGSINGAFSRKQNLNSEALRHYFEANQTALRQEFSGVASPLSALAEHIRTYVKMPEGHPGRRVCMLMKTVINTKAAEPELWHQAKGYIAAARGDIASVLAAAKRLGELPDDANCENLARRFQANLGALRVEFQQSDDADGLAQLAEDMANEIEHLRIPD